jgi:hypothetical protein
MIKRTDCVGLILGSLLMTLGCSTASTPATNSEAVRQHADKAFQQLNAQEHSQQHSDPHASPQAAALGDTTTMPLPSIQQRGQIPSAEIGSSDGEYIRATGYGNLAKGFYLCQHSADLAARVELSKLAHVTVTERSTDRIRERTGKEAEQDIEVVREGLVNEVLRDVRIVDRSVSKEAGTCSSTAMISKRNLFSTPAGSDARTSGPQ